MQDAILRMREFDMSAYLETMSARDFRSVGLVARAAKRSVVTTLTELGRFLLNDGRDVLISEETVALLGVCLPDGVTVVPVAALAARCDLIVVVGGDGSMLQAARSLVGAGTPILGVNRGRLGFLSDINPEQATLSVAQVLAGDFQLDARFLLQMQIVDDGQIVHEDVALNDVVLHAGKSVHTIDYQLSVDGVDVYRHHADGLIVATPTGSTAYSLSAGGPIIHPSLNAICLSPMYPHTLSSRPILVSGDSRIDIHIHKDNRTQPMVSADGKSSVPLHAHQTLSIVKFAKPLLLLHPKGFDFYAACRTKLNWSLYSDDFSLENDVSQDDE